MNLDGGDRARRYLTLEEQERAALLGWCVHFTGVQNQSCAVGVSYDSVRQTEEGTGRFLGWPCLRDHGLEARCPQHRYLEGEELETAVREGTAKVRESLARFKRRLVEECCIHCGVKVERYRQVGRCVYGEPCNHRQWQGRAPKAKQR